MKSLADKMTFDILGSRGNSAICLPADVNWNIKNTASYSTFNIIYTCSVKSEYYKWCDKAWLSG